MNTRPFEYRKENKAYSIMIADSIPENSVNLAYINAPRVNAKNTIVSNEQVFSGDVLTENKHSMYYPFYDIDDDIKRLQTITSKYTFGHNNLLITDEFTLKENSTDIPKPLYCTHRLQFSINGNDSRGIIQKSIPYFFGYEERTKNELELKLSGSQSNIDILPLIDICSIYDSAGKIVDPKEYKIRMLVDAQNGNNDIFKAVLYHSLDEKKTYKIVYVDKDNVTRTEIVKSDVLSTKASSLNELKQSSFVDKKYYINDTKAGYEVYVKNEMYKIDDEVRKPFDFRYKILGNVNAKFTSDNDAMFKIGMIYLQGAASEEEEANVNKYDIRNFLVTLSQEIGDTFPSYIKFYNPYPPSGYKKINPYESIDPAINKLVFDEKYWETSLSYPQEHINEYDLLIITGYGEYDLSAYTKRIKSYLRQGGKVLIDNSTNSAYNLLQVKFNDSEFFQYTFNIKEDMTSNVLTNAREWATTNCKEYNRYYNLAKGFDMQKVGYQESGINVAPEYSVNLSSNWTDIIKFNGGGKCLGYYTHKEDGVNLGRIYMSNAGLLKAYNYNTEESTRKLCTNLFMSILEDIWISTPYQYERVYHIDQLYEQEIELMNYIVEAEDVGVVAKRKILNNARDTVIPFSSHNIYNFPCTYYFSPEEYISNNATLNKEWLKSTRIVLPSSVTDNENVYAYTKEPGTNDFDINSKEGYSKLNIKIYKEDVTFKYTVRPFCYKWNDSLSEDLLFSNTGKYYVGYPMIQSSIKVYKISSEGKPILLNKTNYSITTSTNCITLNSGSNMTDEYFLRVEYKTNQIVQEKIYATAFTENEFSVSSGDGVVEIGKLSMLLPPIPDDEGFSTRDNVFYEVEVAKTGDNGMLDRSEDRINLFIYDKKESKFMFNAEGKSVISYNDLNMMEAVSLDGDIYNNSYRYKTSDYYLVASTGYYSLTASKRAFGVEMKDEKDIDIKLPVNYNTNECWFPRIKNIDFIKKTFNKDDYIRWERMFGFKFEKEYVVKRLTEIFAGKAGAPASDIKDDVIKNIVERLNDNEELEQEDIKIISEFFNVISTDNLEIEYNLVEYEKQSWNPSMPTKYIYGEKAKYIDNNTISLSYENIKYDRYLNDGAKTRDVVERVSSTQVKINNSFILFGYGHTFLLEAYNSQLGQYVTINPSLYSVDYKRGIVTFKSSTSLTTTYDNMLIYATYCYSTIQILKRINKPANRNKVLLTKMSDNWYESPDSYIIGSSSGLVGQGENKGIYLNPTLYLKTKSISKLNKLDVTQYQVDYDRGMFKLNRPYADYEEIYADYSYVEYDWLEIDDVDETTGVVTLSDKNTITFRDTIVANYYYEDKFIDYRGYLDIDKNGTRRWVRLDLNPTRGHVCTVSTSNKEGSKVNWIDVPTNKLIGSTVYFYILPKTITKNKKIIGTNTVTLKHTFDFNELKLLQLQKPELMYIGCIKLVDDYTRYDIEVLDSRTRGGGLHEEYSKSYIQSRNESSLNWWDISPMNGDGFKSNGITIIKLPRHILETFTHEEVELIIGEHLACGVYPIIKYVDINTVGDVNAGQEYADGDYSNI